LSALRRRLQPRAVELRPLPVARAVRPRGLVVGHREGDAHRILAGLGLHRGEAALVRGEQGVERLVRRAEEEEAKRSEPTARAAEASIPFSTSGGIGIFSQ